MDSYRPHQQQYMRPPPPPPPSTSDPYHYQQQQGGWYSNQNQYQYQSSPPPPQQWGPPPHAEHLPPPPGSYAPPPPPPPPHPPYSSRHYHPQSRPQLPPQSYHPQQLNQDWGAQSRPSSQGWEYPAHNNEQDWAAKARAWAARVAMENQDQQSQFTLAGRPEEQTHYHEQYPQSQHPSFSGSSYLQVPVSGTPTHQPPGIHPQNNTFISSEPASYGHHTVRSAIPSVHQQEVPSSYSSVTGNDASAELNEHSYNLLPMPNSSGQEGQYHMQPSHAIPFGYGSHSADPATNLTDQPLEFASGFNSDHGAHTSSYSYHDSVGNIRGVDTTVPSMNSWSVSVAPGVVYPPTPVLPSGPQHDPSMTIPSPVPGNAHAFGSYPGLSLQPTMPTAGPPFALTAGTAVHPTVAFPGDAYGVSTISERPKKASVPNWLREEIKKVSITTSMMDHLKEETRSVEDEGVDRSFGKGDQADRKSIDSSKSTEEEDDEDEVEVARTAAINKEIKHILTEVLSKVTNELFDEIATKVLSEDDPTSEVGVGRLPSNHNKVFPSSPAVSAAKASTKLLIPAKTKESETEDVSEKSSSSTPGDILGLASYATDDDDDDDDGGGEIPSSGVPNSESHDANAKGSYPVELEEQRRRQTSMPNNMSKSDISSNRNKSEESNVDKYLHGGTTAEHELPRDNVNDKKNDPQSRESRMKPDKHESKRSSSKENKEVEGGNTDKKGDENRRRQDERPLRKERTDDRNGSKEKIKDRNLKPGDKAKESDSRKRSSHAGVEDKRETDRLRRDSSKEEVSKKRERTKNKEDDRSRHKHSTDSTRHKRRRSSSIDSKDNSVNHANHSSDESSEDSKKRKLHSRRRHSSPSPVRSRRRQVSWSPHSKHSQRRHSPYCSLDSNRGKGSRSRSPVRRQR